MSKEFILSEWLKAGIIDGYKTNALPFCETTDRVAKYLSKNLISNEQAIEIGIACPEPSVEPETDVVEEPETPITDETVIEDETPVIEETTIVEDGAEITEAESGGENVE